MRHGRFWRSGPRIRRAPSAPAPRLGIRQVAPDAPTAGLDHALAQATALLALARHASDSAEVQRLLRWIDAHLDQRLRLTSRSFP